MRCLVPGSLLAFVIVTAACGSGAVWKPPPVSVIPVGTTSPPAPPPFLESEKHGADLEPPGSAQPAAPAPKVAAGPSPISGELPGDLDAPLAASASCKDKECAVPGLYPPSPAIDGRAPAAVWSHDLAAASKVTLPKHSGVDVYGLVLKGSVTVTGPGGGDKPLVVKGWSAFHAAGAGITIAAAAEGARVALAVVGGGEPVAELVVKLRAKDAGKLEWKKRPAPIEVVDLAASKDLEWAGGAMHARIGFEGDKQRASLGILIASKDAPVAAHQHDGSWEILAALRASGTVKRAKEAGATELTPAEVADGSVVAIPKGAQHAWVPGGTKPLVALQLYVPPGPEQRFKKLAEAQPARSQK